MIIYVYIHTHTHIYIEEPLERTIQPGSLDAQSAVQGLSYQQLPRDGEHDIHHWPLRNLAAAGNFTHFSNTQYPLGN